MASQAIDSSAVFVDTYVVHGGCPHCDADIYVTTTRPRGKTIETVSVSHNLPNKQTVIADRLTGNANHER